ncbi:hypothetical protein ACFVXH_20015 [Kitasatospora sp. NPDC058184]|uniref:hypothetical protein n=1 Tax=Kitasatospora sp. NPDC058184 TaxID=3346370 RepID=UPI0036D85F1F
MSLPHSVGSVDDQLSVLDSLLAAPFPERADTRTEHGWGGPGHQLAVLRASRDFWDAPGPETVTEAEEELEADLTALTAVLADRWGAPDTIDLWSHLGYDQPDFADTDGPEPLVSLASLVFHLPVWRVPSTGRWVGLIIGQADREFPLELLVAIGEESCLPR